MCRLISYALGALLAGHANLCAQTSALPELDEQDPQGVGRQVHAREPSTPPEDWLRATGRWSGARDWLAERGIGFEVVLTNDASLVARGGVDPHGSALRTLVDAAMTFDTEPLLGLRGGQLFLDLQHYGATGSAETGALQPFSNIDADARTQLARITYEQSLWDRAVSVKVGKSAADADFAYVEYGFRFIHSSFGHSPTILGMPAYPDPSYGASLFVRPGDGFYAGAGVYDGAAQTGVQTGERGPRTLFGSPSDLFLVGEAGRKWDGEGLPGRAGIGAWRHTGDFARFDGGTDHGTSGFYFVMDQKLWAPAGAGDSGRGIGCCLQYGHADAQVSPIEQHVGAALEWTGPCDQRPHDAIGLGASWASFSRVPGAGLQGSGELAVELFYTLQVTPWLSFKPDVQYIVNPGGLAGVDDALVFTLRTSITF